MNGFLCISQIHQYFPLKHFPTYSTIELLLRFIHVQLWRGWAGLKQQLDAEQFADSVDNCTDQLHQLKQRWHSDSQATLQVFTIAGELVGSLKLNVGLDYQQARQQMEDHVMRLKDQQQHIERTWRWRQSCLEAWLAMHQFALDIAMVSE